MFRRSTHQMRDPYTLPTQNQQPHSLSPFLSSISFFCRKKKKKNKIVLMTYELTCRTHIHPLFLRPSVAVPIPIHQPQSILASWSIDVIRTRKQAEPALSWICRVVMVGAVVNHVLICEVYLVRVFYAVVLVWLHCGTVDHM